MHGRARADNFSIRHPFWPTLVHERPFTHTATGPWWAAQRHRGLLQSRGENFKHVGNKHKRQDLYREHRKNKAQEKLKKRIARAKEERGEEGAEKKRVRLEANVTKTIENTREFNPTIINAPNTHPGPGPSTSAVVAGPSSAVNQTGSESEGDSDDPLAQSDDEDDESDAGDEDEDPHAPPALLITTSMPSNSTSPHLSSANARSHPAERVRNFVDELLNIFPGAEYRPRAKAKGVGLGKIAGWARGRGYGGMLIVGEDKKEPFSLTVVGLPRGPTAFFRLTSISIGKEIYGHARPTPHTPELILNNFTTTLGHQVGSLLQSLFPKIPQLEGRQVVTAHNQRDYVFFRRHRYLFKNEDKAKLQEIGPRFTLKLQSLKEGLPKGAGVWDGEVHFEGKPKETTGRGEEEAGEEGSEAEAMPAKRKRKSTAPDEEHEGYNFQWTPKMGVSRRNFYL